MSWVSLAAAALLSLLCAVALVYAFTPRHAAPAAPASRVPSFSRDGLLSLPLAARGPVSAAVGAAEPAYSVSVRGGGFAAVSPAQRLQLGF
ncbi:MAG: hypothetical protein ACLP1Q_19490, partial [Solirubrobacteraceae bacterium]